MSTAEVSPATNAAAVEQKEENKVVNPVIESADELLHHPQFQHELTTTKLIQAEITNTAKSGPQLQSFAHSTFGNILALQQQENEYNIGLTSQGYVVVWDTEESTLQDFEQLYDCTLLCACFVTHHQRTFTFFALMDDGTGVLGTFTLNVGTIDGVNRRVLRSLSEVKRRKNMFTFTGESRPSLCVHHACAGWIMIVEGADVSAWNEIIEPVWGCNIIQTVQGNASGAGGVHTGAYRHDLRTRKTHAITSLACSQMTHTVYVGTRSGYLCKIDTRRKETRTVADAFVIKRFREMVLKTTVDGAPLEQNADAPRDDLARRKEEARKKKLENVIQAAFSHSPLAKAMKQPNQTALSPLAAAIERQNSLHNSNGETTTSPTGTAAPPSLSLAANTADDTSAASALQLNSTQTAPVFLYPPQSALLNLSSEYGYARYTDSGYKVFDHEIHVRQTTGSTAINSLHVIHPSAHERDILLAVASSDGMTHVVRTYNGDTLYCCLDPTLVGLMYKLEPILCVTAVNDGTILVTLDSHGVLRRWDLASHSLVGITHTQGMLHFADAESTTTQAEHGAQFLQMNDDNTTFSWHSEDWFSIWRAQRPVSHGANLLLSITDALSAREAEQKEESKEAGGGGREGGGTSSGQSSAAGTRRPPFPAIPSLITAYINPETRELSQHVPEGGIVEDMPTGTKAEDLDAYHHRHSAVQEILIPLMRPESKTVADDADEVLVSEDEGEDMDPADLRQDGEDDDSEHEASDEETEEQSHTDVEEEQQTDHENGEHEDSGVREAVSDSEKHDGSDEDAETLSDEERRVHAAAYAALASQPLRSSSTVSKQSAGTASRSADGSTASSAQVSRSGSRTGYSSRHTSKPPSRESATRPRPPTTDRSVSSSRHNFSAVATPTLPLTSPSRAVSFGADLPPLHTNTSSLSASPAASPLHSSTSSRPFSNQSTRTASSIPSSRNSLHSQESTR